LVKQFVAAVQRHPSVSGPGRTTAADRYFGYQIPSGALRKRSRQEASMTRSQSQKSRAASGLQLRTTPEHVRAMNPGDEAARETPGTGEDVCPREPEPSWGIGASIDAAASRRQRRAHSVPDCRPGLGGGHLRDQAQRAIHAVVGICRHLSGLPEVISG
jgi:hypothetical protein